MQFQMIVRIDVSLNLQAKALKRPFSWLALKLMHMFTKQSHLCLSVSFSNKISMTTAAKATLQCPQQSLNYRYDVYVHTKKTEL